MILEVAAADGAAIVPWLAGRAKHDPRILAAVAVVMLVMRRLDGSFAGNAIFAHRYILP